jgi:hypothetical protein
MCADFSVRLLYWHRTLKKVAHVFRVGDRVRIRHGPVVHYPVNKTPNYEKSSTQNF